MTPLTYGSVCSGIEGASVAWAPLGWRCAFMAEIEAFPRAVLKHHYPDVPLIGDFTHLRDPARSHEALLVETDVLVGGTPCQGFSVAGLRGSLGDDRSNLCLEFIRLADAIDDLRRAAGRPPCWILWENVPGVFSTEDNAFGAFLGGLVGCDAALDPGPRGKWTDAGVVAGPERVAAWRVLDAQHFGLAQRRRRVFVLALGGAGAWACADALLPLADSLQGYPAPRRQARERAAPTISARTSAGGGLGTDFDCDGGLIETAPSLTAAGGTDHKHGQGFGQREYETDGFLQVTGAFDDGSVGSVTSKWHKGTGGYAGAEHYNLIAHALDAHSAGGATEDGTGRGVPLITEDVAYALRPPSDGAVWRADGCDNLISHTLKADGFDASEDGTGRGVPLIAFTKNDAGGDIGEDISPTLRAGEFAGSHANAGVMPAIAFNWQNGGGYGEAHDGLGITEDGVGPLDASTIKAVAIPITADAARRGAGTALTPSPDAAGRIRLRDPGFGIGQDGDPAPTLQAAGPGAVFTLASRGRGDGHQLEFRDDELANAVLTPSGGRAGIGVGAVAFQTRGSNLGVEEDLTGTLGTNADCASGGAPMVAFTQNQRSELRFTGGDGEVSGSLQDRPSTNQQTYLAVDLQNVALGVGDVSGTLDTTRPSRGGGQAVAFTLHGADGTTSTASETDTHAALRSRTPGTVENSTTTAVLATSAVRRLTPTECERLQGFPNGYTDVPFRGKAAADGPRYKSLGNSFATPVIRWIGERIAAVAR